MLLNVHYTPKNVHNRGPKCVFGITHLVVEKYESSNEQTMKNEM